MVLKSKNMKNEIKKLMAKYYNLDSSDPNFLEKYKEAVEKEQRKLEEEGETFCPHCGQEI